MMEALQQFMLQERMFSFEGDRGVKNLTRIVEVLGYGKGFMRGRALEEFLADNPAAIEAVVEFIGEWSERNSEWNDALQMELFEEVDE
jgi:hypothetical protein